MKLGKPALKRLSEMICGNTPFDHFPYRSSSQLTKFFFDLDLEYVHDGSTRSAWVETTLQELNEKDDNNEKLPSRDLSKVIVWLVNPDFFLFDDKLNHEKAIEDVNKALKSSGLTLKLKADGQSIIALLNGEFISTAIKETEVLKTITFAPSVFKIPQKEINQKLISVMMPFNPAFRGTYESIKKVTEHMNLECLRADDIWENSTFIQDIFDLIYCARIIIVDFSERNPNVMYETGIAHTLGKTVIPIAQSLSDVPSDLGHHRVLKYLPNDEGYRNLSNDLYKRIKTILEEK
ncbi:MAG: hypothetical protein EOP00_23435 [Pedobacter sp.]|nr:MAG: hypothetical protein EOP00_23435 [Pedobacter sp.]